MIDSSLKERFLDYELRSIVHPLVREHFTHDEVLGNLAAEIDADISKGTDTALAERFRNQCPVRSASASDYMIRHIVIEPGFDILAGIRFRGLDLKRPFVAILHRNRAFENESHLRKVMDDLHEEFAIFSPKAVLFYLSSHNEQFLLPGEVVDKRILMGSLAEIASIPVVADITVTRAVELDFYELYKEEYEYVSKLSPDYLRTETAESEEDMEWCVKEGLTYKIFLGDEFAGVFVVTESTFLGAHGYYVIENLLFEKFRGRKLAASVQSTVAKELLALGGKVIYGSIYPTNVPSYHAALASRRIDIGGNYMVPIE